MNTILASAGGRARLASIDPATHETVGEVDVTPVGEIAAVVGEALRARRPWSALPPRERAAAIRPVADAFVRRLPELALLITREMGKPVAQAEAEVRHFAAGLGEKLDEIAAALEPERVEDAETRSTIHFEGYGACAVIAPWNFPFAEPLEMMIPALMAGNGVVLKPSEETPLVAEALVGILNGYLPAGLLAVVQGGEDQGKALVADPGISLVVFTGSQAAGRHILASGSARLKRVILELGGKDPLIVMSDADVELAAGFAAQNAFRNAGQVCVSTERIFVDASLADRFEARLVALTRALKIGPGTDPANHVGPMVNQAQKQRVLRLIDDALGRGATALVDGTKGFRDNGNYLGPTVLSGVKDTMDIVRQEVFGPVTCVTRFEDVEDAVAMANDSDYGLGAVVFGADLDRAGAVARRLEAGMVGINRRSGGARGTPWIGAKQSGFSWHSGREGHRHFAQAKVISLPR